MPCSFWPFYPIPMQSCPGHLIDMTLFFFFFLRTILHLGISLLTVEAWNIELGVEE